MKRKIQIGAQEEFPLRIRNWLAVVLTAGLVGFVFLPCGALFAAKGSDYIKELEGVEEKKKELEEQIGSTNAKIQGYLKQIDQAKKKMDQLQGQVEDTEVKLREAMELENYYRNEFNKRVRYLYTKGETNTLALLLEADSFSEFLARYELARTTAKKDYYIFSQWKKNKEKVAEEKRKLDQLLAEQEKLVEQSTAYVKELKTELQKHNIELEKIEEKYDYFEDEIVRINMRLFKDGKLNFPFNGKMIRPLPPQYPVSSHFGQKRLHPIYHVYQPHKGTDIAAPLKTPYYAAADGVVVESRYSSGYGWIITIYHGHKNGKAIMTRYGHSRPEYVKVRVGQEVKAGEVIALVGSYGDSTGPHLHFEVREGSMYNPNGATAVDSRKYVKW